MKSKLTLFFFAALTLSAQRTFSGCPIGAYDSVYNTRIDSLPVHANSAAWVAQSMAIGSAPLTFEAGFGVNLISSSTPASRPKFTYTPSINGQPFVFATNPRRRENGELTNDGNSDHHMISMNTQTCQVYESYQDGGGANGNDAQSGYTYKSDSYAQPAAGGNTTDAAGLPLLPLIVHRAEIESGSIGHALRFTSCAGCIARSFVWPATYSTGSGVSSAPMGTRWRLAASFDISKYSRSAQVILTALKQYGMILADIGMINQIEVSSDVHQDPAISAALTEISASALHQDSFEVIDESALMADVNSNKALGPHSIQASVDSGKPFIRSLGDTIRIDVGSTANYTDSGGHVWLADVGSESGTFTRQNDNYPASAWAGVVDAPLYQTYDYTYGDDKVMGPFAVTLGDYDVTFYFARGQCSGTYTDGGLPAGPLALDVNGSLTTFDVEAAENHTCRTPASKTIRATGVSSITAAVRSITVGQTHSTPQLNAFSIIPVAKPIVTKPAPIPAPVPVSQRPEVHADDEVTIGNVMSSKRIDCSHSKNMPLGAWNMFCLDVRETIADGGTNYNYAGPLGDSLPGKQTFSITNWEGEQIIKKNATLGQAIGRGIGVEHTGTGDTSADSLGSFSHGGCMVATDQCGQGLDVHVIQGTPDFIGQWNGTVATGYQGARVITVNSSQGDGSAGSGRYVLDAQGVTESYCKVTAINSAEFSATPAAYTVTCPAGTSLPATTVVGTLGAAVYPGVQTAIAGIPSGALACIADQYYAPEFVTVTNGSFTTIRPHTASAIVSSGPGCGQFIALTADDVDAHTYDDAGGNPTLVYQVKNRMRRAWPIVSIGAASVDPTSGISTQTLRVAVQGKGAWRQVVSQWDAAKNNGFTILAGAEIYSVQKNGVISNTWALSPNGAPFAPGDAIEVPDHAAVGFSLGEILIQQEFPDFATAGGHFGVKYAGAVRGGAMFDLSNTAPISKYVGSGGKWDAPIGVRVQGPVLYSFFSQYGGLFGDINVGCSAGCSDQWHWLLRKAYGQHASGVLVDETSGKMTISSNDGNAQIQLDGANKSLTVLVGLPAGCLYIDENGKVKSTGKPCK